jgi:hypothetical protein
MDRRRYSFLAEVTLFVLILSLGFMPRAAIAKKVWSDDFDDGNYTDNPAWTVRHGTFSCSEKKLVGTYDSTPDGPTWGFDNEIYINSTVSHGTWSFDLYYGCQDVGGPAFWFACDEMHEGDWSGYGWPGGFGHCVQRGYEPQYGWQGWGFHRVNVDHEEHMESWNATGGIGTGYHVYFTYDEFGYLEIWENGTYLGKSLSTWDYDSQYILICLNSGSWIDNIQVWDEVIPLLRNAPVLDDISPNPDPDGNVRIDWNDDAAAVNWSAYRHSSEITEANLESATKIASGLTESQYDDTTSSGSYWYAVEAIDAFGYSKLSNSVNVTVSTPTPSTPTPTLTPPPLDMTLLIAGAGVAVVVIVAAVVFMRKN